MGLNDFLIWHNNRSFQLVEIATKFHPNLSWCECPFRICLSQGYQLNGNFVKNRSALDSAAISARVLLKIGSEKCSPIVKCDHLFVKKPTAPCLLNPGVFTNYNLLAKTTVSKDGFLTKKNPHKSYAKLMPGCA
jgi:hypothetical protein